MTKNNVIQLYSKSKKFPKPTGDELYDRFVELTEWATKMNTEAAALAKGGQIEEAKRLKREADLAKAWGDVYGGMWKIERAEWAAEANRRSGGNPDTPLRDIFDLDKPMCDQIPRLRTGLYWQSIIMLSEESDETEHTS